MRDSDIATGLAFGGLQMSLDSLVWESLRLYKWTILSALAIAPALALVGAQSLARGWSLRALVVGQGTSFGTYFALLMIGWIGWTHDSGHTVEDFQQFLFILTVSIILAASIGLLTIWIERRLLRPGDPMQPQAVMAFFTLLLAASALIVAVSPHLESHLASAFTGDLSTASDLESRLTLGLGLGVLGWVWLRWRVLSQAAFKRVVLLKDEGSFGSIDTLDIKFSLLALLAMALTVHALGVLFVLGSLFVPSSVLSLASGKTQSLTAFRRQLVVTAVLGSAVGFGLSLISTTLPTAPMIVFSQALFGIAIGLGARMISSINNQAAQNCA
jgi:zinc/manganese transport system permease protein